MKVLEVTKFVSANIGERNTCLGFRQKLESRNIDKKLKSVKKLKMKGSNPNEIKLNLYLDS